MERSLKRSRIGPSPFDDDDADEDELNSRPEDVNLRRDPGYQLQKSRAFAAFKLKSTFESIFEKYEKDFTGVGDEILLSTGEIAVNNGHLESLKDQHFDVEDEGDAEEEERILQGRPDNRLSRLAQNPMPLTIQPRPPIFSAQWQPTSHFMGGPPMLSSPMYPGQMPFGRFTLGATFPSPIPQSFDPAWNAPALPMPTFGGAFGSIAPAPQVKRKQLLITAGGADDEDDLLLGVSTATEKPASVARAPTKPPPALRLLEDGSSEKEQLLVSSDSRPEKQAPKKAIFKSPSEPPKKTGSGKKRVAKAPLDLTPSLAPTGSSSPLKTADGAASLPKLASTAASKSQATVPSSSSSTRPKSRGRPKKSDRATVAGCENERGLYVDTSGLGGKPAAKPSNQRLQVEIRVMKPFDSSSYMIVPPEPTREAESARIPSQVDSQATVTSGVDAMDVEKALPSPPLLPAKDNEVAPNTAELKKGSSQEKAQCPSPPAEVFSRNILDPSYAFSDEDEPTLPRARFVRQKPAAGQTSGARKEVSADAPSALGPQPVAGKQRRKAKKPLSLRDPGTPEPSSEATNATSIQEEVAEEEPEQKQEKVAENQGIPILEVASPITSDLAFPPTSSPTRSRDERRAAGNTASILELVDVAPTPVSSSPAHISPQDYSSIILEQQLPTERRKRKHSLDEAETDDSPSKRPEPFSSPGRIPRDQIIPETPDGPSNADIPHRSRLPREPSPDLGFRDPPARSPLPLQPSTAPPKPTTTTLTLNPRHATPQTPSSKSTIRRLSRPPGSGKGILSLLPFDANDEDELSLGPEDFTPSGSRRVRPPSSTRTPSSSLRTRSSVSKSGASVRVRTPQSKGPVFTRLAATGHRRRSLLRMDRGVASSPVRSSSSSSRVGSEVIQTPGGSRRRCGEGGFRCDRDFCFVCL